jgi:hypothetical protein
MSTGLIGLGAAKVILEPRLDCVYSFDCHRSGLSDLVYECHIQMVTGLCLTHSFHQSVSRHTRGTSTLPVKRSLPLCWPQRLDGDVPSSLPKLLRHSDALFCVLGKQLFFVHPFGTEGRTEGENRRQGDTARRAQ